MSRWRSLAPAALAVACAGDAAGPAHLPAPEVLEAHADANPHNVISAIVRVSVQHADRVSVRYRPIDAGPAAEAVAPAVPVVDGHVTAIVLGLEPERRYVLRAVATGPGGAAEADDVEFMTGALPADLPRYRAGGPDPSPGFIVFAVRDYGIVIDNTGRIVWYRHFPDGPGLNFMAQPNGRYVARPVTPDPHDPEPWIEIDPTGAETRTLECAGGLRSRFHDLLVQPDGSYFILCDEIREMDLSSMGGVAGARVTGTAIQRRAANGELLFAWSPFDHLSITDLNATERTGASVNWTHGNALALDEDGNLLLSSRNLSEITKIDARTGTVLWRMGGHANQFTFDGATVPAFARQHSVRAGTAGTLLLLDNVGDPAESRAERYLLDERARTARLLESHGAGVVTQIGGSVQDLPGGRILVSFGTAGRVVEYLGDGRIAWEIVGDAGYVFRAMRIASLYHPGSAF